MSAWRNTSRRVPMILAIAVTLVVVACAKNPVTGRNEFLIVGESWEMSVGEQQYVPLRQAQGGDYVVDPEVEKYVREVGNRLAAVSDRKLPYEFNVINNGVPNAWALPGGKISINRGLLTELKSEAELAAVLGHEIVHAAAKHGARGQTRGLLLQGAVMGATIAGAKKGYGELAQLGSSIGAQLVNSRYGRDAELESDLYGMEYMQRAGYDPRAAIELQRTFVKLSEGQRQDFLSGLFASHPPSEERVRKNAATAQKLGAGGEVGADRYQKVMARLNRSAPAYEAFDKAQLAGRDGNLQQAETLARQAVRIEPKEAHFQSLLGDIALEKNDLRAAKQYYDKAIGLNDEFFYYYLQRGKVLSAANNNAAAQRDFERSMALLPTADAQEALGLIAERNGDTRQAMQYYANAAQSDGPAADAALERLQALGMASNPAGFLQVRQGLSEQGTYMIEIVNRAPRGMGDVMLGFETVSSGSMRTQKLPGSLKAGERRVIDTGRRMSVSDFRNIRVSIVSAKPLG